MGVVLGIRSARIGLAASTSPLLTHNPTYCTCVRHASPRTAPHVPRRHAPTTKNSSVSRRPPCTTPQCTMHACGITLRVPPYPPPTAHVYANQHDQVGQQTTPVCRPPPPTSPHVPRKCAPTTITSSVSSSLLRV